MRISDLVLGILLLLAGVTLALAARSYPNLPTQAYGAATFPFAIGLGLALLGAILIGGALLRGEVRGQPLVALEGWGRERAAWMRLGLVLGLVAAYVVLSPTLGFLLGAGGLLLGLLLVFRVRLWLALVVTLPAVLAFAQVFGGLLRVPLPRSALLGGLW